MSRFDRSRRVLLGFAATAPWLRALPALAQPTGGDKLRIGVIGSGHIGGTIGRLWVKSGHPVADARRFQRGAPGYGQSVTAAELRQKLSLTR